MSAALFLPVAPLALCAGVVGLVFTFVVLLLLQRPLPPMPEEVGSDDATDR